MQLLVQPQDGDLVFQVKRQVRSQLLLNVGVEGRFVGRSARSEEMDVEKETLA